MNISNNVELKIEETGLNLLTSYNTDVPHIIKYMGSKRTILDFLVNAINETYEEGKLCDLFGGTSILAGALGQLIPIHSNDIQLYSAILANTYLSNYDWEQYDKNILDEIVLKASNYVSLFKKANPSLVFDYREDMSIKEFIDLENHQKELINSDFSNFSYHLFVKYYSGTYWNFDQCLWIDALRKTADEYVDTPIYFVILSSLMYAMSYNSQSTGHYAQYRTATSSSSQKDILGYRLKQILPYFKNKFNHLRLVLKSNIHDHRITCLDYEDCLNTIEENSLVYADPPYAFVHYSRFYHILETLIRYDYPDVEYKGRYRMDRHQSPFCKRTEVGTAFKKMFAKINEKNASLILSYSNTGMIRLDEILEIAHEKLDSSYSIITKEVDYKHSTMGRKDDKSKEVKEYLIIAR